MENQDNSNDVIPEKEIVAIPGINRESIIEKLFTVDRQIEEIIPELVKLTPLDYEKVRGDVATRYGVRLSTLDSEVKIKSTMSTSESPAQPETMDVFPEPVDGVELYQEIKHLIERHVYFSKSEYASVVAMWTLGTWFRDDLYFAPILAILSPAKRCGKTFLLDILKGLVRNPQMTSGTGVTPATIFRLNEILKPTFLIDEAEKLSGRETNKDVIGLLNSGYRNGAMVQRCVGNNHDVRHFDAFGWRVVAAIGDLWDTLMDRSIIIRMDRKPSSVKINRFDSRKIEDESLLIRQKIKRWVLDNKRRVTESENLVPRPDQLNDRSCDNWSPLFSVGMALSEEVLNEILSISLMLERISENPDLGELLLSDIQEVFEELNYPKWINTKDLIMHLIENETSPWGDFSGGQLTPHRLSKLLKPFCIGPIRARNGKENLRGYQLSDFKPVFMRYLPALESPVLKVEQLEHLEQAGKSRPRILTGINLE